MLLSTILFITMVASFISYVSYIWIKYGIQTSISNSYYALSENMNWLFVAFTWLFAFPTMIIGNSYLMLFAGAGIVFVGAAAAIHHPIVSKIHNISAITGISLALIAIIFQYHMWYIAAAVAALILLAYLIDKKYLIWWAEIIVFFGISTALGITLF